MTTRYTATGHVPDEMGLSVLRRPAHTIARLRGELDIATAPALREWLAALLQPRRTRLLIMDLSEVGFCDAAGLAVLIGTQRRATPLGIALRLAAPRSQIAKVLHATGLDRSLSVHPTLADALTPNPLTRHTATASARFSRPAPSPGWGTGRALLDFAAWGAAPLARTVIWRPGHYESRPSLMTETAPLSSVVHSAVWHRVPNPRLRNKLITLGLCAG